MASFHPRKRTEWCVSSAAQPARNRVFKSEPAARRYAAELQTAGLAGVRATARVTTGWLVRVRCKGAPNFSQTFDRKSDAEAWARDKEGEIARRQFVDFRVADRTSLGELLVRYESDHLSHRHRHHPDRCRARMLAKHAYARKGQLGQARAALALADAGAAKVIQAHPSNKGFERTLRCMVTAATDRLRAEIASAEGRHDVALALQAQALVESRRADDNEPPLLAAGDRLVLAEMQLRAGRAALAEQTFRDDLAAQPDSGWALDGLARALKAQGKSSNAQALQPKLDHSWALADAALCPLP